MSKIAFWMLHQEGHLNPSLRLAKALRARGHQICYLTIPDYEDWVTRAGFEFVPVFEKVYPRGMVARERALPHAALDGREEERSAGYREYFMGHELGDRLRTLAPDLLIIDVLWGLITLAARHLGIPCALLSTSLPQGPEPGVPPLTSILPPGNTPERAAAATQAWEDLYESFARSGMAHKLRVHVEELRHKYDCPPEWIGGMGAFMVHIPKVPELVLCSPTVDFPRPSNPLRHYIESLWLDRPEPEFPWERLDSSKQLVYCALGSQVYRIPGAHRFFSEVLEAAARRPDWQLVLAHGERFSAADFAHVPDNVILVRFAPQLALLARSRLIISHGGLGTFKESMYFRAPMLMFPAEYDQFGNAARLAHHGLGMSGDFQTATAAEIVRMADAVLADAELPARLARVHESFMALETAQPGVHLIEQMLAR